MFTLLLGVGGCWILPALPLDWLLHKPPGLPWQDFVASAWPRLRVRRMRVGELMLLVLVVSIDAAATLAMAPASLASTLVVADIGILSIVLAIASFVELSPAQCAVMAVFLAVGAMVVMWLLLAAEVV
jgi:hypothetical protein